MIFTLRMASKNKTKILKNHFFEKVERLITYTENFLRADLKRVKVS